MMNFRIDERHSYIEIEVFGAYQADRMDEIFSAMRDLSEKNGYFSLLEIQHQKPMNLIRSMQNLGSKDDPEAYKFMETFKKFALVSDNPPIVMRLLVLMSRSSKVQMRIFPMQDRDRARQWIEGVDDAYMTH